MSTTTDHRGTVSHCFRCGFTQANNRTRTPGNSFPRAGNFYRAWLELAHHLWNKTQPIRGTLAERYLLSRECMLPPEDGDLRFLPASGEHSAAMLARVTDVVTGEPISLHFTTLDEVGAKLGRRLLAGHRKAGGVIRLYPDAEVTLGIAIAEGIESALSAAHVYAPVWATVDAGNMGTLPVLNGIEALTIFADNDAAGLRAARACGRRWRDAGCAVRIRIAATGDVNDALRSLA